MKKHIFILYPILLALCLGISSCEDYLDVAPEVEISDKEVFGTFLRYQGFVEDMYQCLPDWTRAKYNIANWNWSNDIIALQTQYFSYYVERGDYWKWTNQAYGNFLGTNEEHSNNQGAEAGNANRRAGIWRNGWEGIRTANIAIQNIDMLQGTLEERNLILGQAYFFRAFFHFQILACWGGVPYVDKVFEPADKLDWPRLSYLETAIRINEDLEKAAELLPASWNETVAGQATLGGNVGRVTKGACYAYIGKNWLYAASPLMNGTETGDYSSYNTELAQKAAVAFDKLLKLTDSGYYGLHSWAEYRKNFWTVTNESLIGKEWVWGHPYYKTSRYNYGEMMLTELGGQASGYGAPTLELINKFGMANGLPIDEADSGYDPVKPWANRDPRFYYSIIVDGEKILHYTTNYPTDTYAQFFLNGRHRDNAVTGFGQKKFLPPGRNKLDNKYWTSNNFVMMVPYMRLAHAYLMYAEAANEAYGGTNGKAPGGITAVEAVNIVRARAGVPAVDARFLTSRETFRNVIRNEIGVETCLENHQWYDYRRWYIAHLMENRIKTRLDYDKKHTYFTPVVERTILFDQAKHYWLPFQRTEAALYPEYYQNPGW
ncbi:MAG: RagB/SusD family nutrient uptake outer membrane protein [Prolixibacteraceae bacterium]